MTKSIARAPRALLRAMSLLGVAGLGLSGCVYSAPGPYAYESPPGYYYPQPYYYGGPSVSLDFRAGREHFRDRDHWH